MDNLGEDIGMDTAVSKIMALAKADPAIMGGPLGENEQGRPVAPAQKREARTDRDPTEKEASGDLDQEEEKARVSQSQEGDKPAAGAVEGDDFLEIPADGEGEPERIPLAKAVELIKQAKTYEGDVATAVVRAEDEVREKASGTLKALQDAYAVTRQRCEMTLRALPQPQRPDPSMLQTNPQAYHMHMLQYEEDVQTFQRVDAQMKEAASKEGQVKAAATAESDAREHERMARFFPEWKNPETRQAMQQKLFTGISKQYGIPAAVLDNAPFHHGLLRMAMDALKGHEAKAAAPAIKAAVVEKAAKVTRSNAPADRDQSGRFVADARKSLKETGSEDAFAAWALKSGLAKF